MHRLVITLTALSLLACAGTALAGGGGNVPPIPRVSGQWSEVSINKTIRRVPHTLILDRGRIIQVAATQITLRESFPKSTAVVPLSPQTLVVIDGLPATPGDLRRKMSVVTMRIDGGAAVRVRATSVK
jgi:hypothetical protein